MKDFDKDDQNQTEDKTITGCDRRRASLVCLVAPRGAPRLVRSGRSRCSGRLYRRLRRRGAFRHPGGLRPRLY